MRNSLPGRFTLLLLTLCMTAIGAAAQPDGNVGLPRFPSISPDGSTVVFSWRGDLYKVPSTGGQAVRLTSHPFNDLASAWSPDGKRLAFTSDRSGAYNIHLVNADGTNPVQLTQGDRPLNLVGFAVDEAGKDVLTFDSFLEPEWYRATKIYHAPIEGGEIRNLIDVYGSHPAVSPDGKKILFNRGTSAWWRRGSASYAMRRAR